MEVEESFLGLFEVLPRNILGVTEKFHGNYLSGYLVGVNDEIRTSHHPTNVTYSLKKYSETLRISLFFVLSFLFAANDGINIGYNQQTHLHITRNFSYVNK